MNFKFSFILFVSACSHLFGQETFVKYDGSDLFPDTDIRIKLGIKEITRETSYKYRPSEFDCYYYSEKGYIDSLVRWSGDDDDPLLCISKGSYHYKNDSLTERFINQYYNIFFSGQDGDQWLPCIHEAHYVYIHNASNSLIEMPGVDSIFLEKHDVDSTEISFTEANIYYLNDTLTKVYLHKKNGIGNESLVIESLSYNKDGLLIEKVKDTCSNENCAYQSKTLYQYNNAGQPLSKIYYLNKNTQGKLVRSLSYDKKGRLTFEKVAPENLGIESRKYSYDSKNRVAKVKEKHFDGFLIRYRITYDSEGLLKTIVARHKYGYETQKFTYKMN